MQTKQFQSKAVGWPTTDCQVGVCKSAGTTLLASEGLTDLSEVSTGNGQCLEKKTQKLSRIIRDPVTEINIAEKSSILKFYLQHFSFLLTIL